MVKPMIWYDDDDDDDGDDDCDSQWKFSDPASLPGAVHWKCDGYKLPGEIRKRNYLSDIVFDV